MMMIDDDELCCVNVDMFWYVFMVKLVAKARYNKIECCEGVRLGCVDWLYECVVGVEVLD